MNDASAAAPEEFDHLVIGGALAGAATAFLLLRKNPRQRVGIIEKSTVFKRRVGESTVEISAAFLSTQLGLTAHLNRAHLVKQGLRFYFTNDEVRSLEECSEIGSIYNVRLPGYQLDRAVLDEEMLQRAEKLGAVVFRPAKVVDFELEAGGMQTVEIRSGDAVRTLRARWLVDASGVAAVIGRKLGLIERNQAHPISAVWARFSNVTDWDALSESERPEAWRSKVMGVRDTATNHLVGRGYWIWVIPLRSGEYSIGVVYDQRQVTFPTEGGTLGARLTAFVSQHPAGAAILKHARYVEKDVLARSDMPYRARSLMGDGWALVGDAAGFLDPFYSPGLDWLAFTTSATSTLLAKSRRRESLADAISLHNERFAICYDRWFQALYEDKYDYMGDLELLDLSFRLDLATYYLGVVLRPLKKMREAWTLPPFAHRNAVPVFKLIRAYNRSLARIGRRRTAQGRFGRRNKGEFRPFSSFEFNYRLPLRLLGFLIRWRWLVITEWFASRGRPPAS